MLRVADYVWNFGVSEPTEWQRIVGPVTPSRVRTRGTSRNIPCWRHTTFVRSGRSGRPRETKGVTVTVPLLTDCEIRALKRPEASSV
jgi:hypothetical protein